MADQALRASEGKLRDLSHRLVAAQEKERATIGNALQDEIGQHLTYATLLIEKVSRNPDRQLLDQARSSVQDAIAMIRDLSMLSPRLLRSAGLLRALVFMTDEYTKSTDIKVDFHFKRITLRSGITPITNTIQFVVYQAGPQLTSSLHGRLD